jgi:uncharacterized protein YggE
MNSSTSLFKNFVTLSLLCIAFAQPAHSDTTPTGITSTGECVAKVSHDRGRVSVGSSTIAKTPSDASKEVNKDHESIKDAIKNLKLPDFTTQTESYIVEQNCSYESGKRVCDGFRASVSTNFETSDLTRLGELVVLAAKMNADEVSGVTTFPSNESLRREREACLEAATRNAAAKANQIAKGAGVTLGGLIAVTESAAPSQLSPIAPFARVAAMEAMSDSRGGPSVESRPVELHVSVIATYSFR